MIGWIRIRIRNTPVANQKSKISISLLSLTRLLNSYFDLGFWDCLIFMFYVWWSHLWLQNCLAWILFVNCYLLWFWFSLFTCTSANEYWIWLKSVYVKNMVKLCPYHIEFDIWNVGESFIYTCLGLCFNWLHPNFIIFVNVYSRYLKFAYSTQFCHCRCVFVFLMSIHCIIWYLDYG